MSDLVERLRAAASHPYNQHGPHEFLTEAAARIEQLEATLQRLTECLCSECHMKAFRAALTAQEKTDG